MSQLTGEIHDAKVVDELCSPIVPAYTQYAHIYCIYICICIRCCNYNNNLIGCNKMSPLLNVVFAVSVVINLTKHHHRKNKQIVNNNNNDNDNTKKEHYLAT